MKAIFYITAVFFTALGLEGLRWSHFEWQAHSMDRSLNDYYLLRNTESGTEKRLHEDLRKLSRSRFASAETHVNYGFFLKHKAEAAPDYKEKVLRYCQALSEYGMAMQKGPGQAIYAVNWGSLRQLLGDTECGLPCTEGDYRRELRNAVKQAPSDRDVAFLSAKIYLWDDMKSEAFRLFRQALLRGYVPSVREREFLIQLIDENNAASRIVPPVFPQITDWTRWLRSTVLSGAAAEHNELKSLHFQALEDLEERYSEGEVSTDFTVDSLISMLSIRPEDEVRQVVDSKLNQLLAASGENSVSEYLGTRSQLTELSVVRGVLNNDYRPEDGMLIGWGSPEPVTVDYQRNSVGFYTESRKRIDYIELVSESLQPNLSMLKLLASDDNRNWQQISGADSMKVFSLGKWRIIQIDVEAEPYRYWKINYSGSGRRGEFRNGLTEMVRVFG